MKPAPEIVCHQIPQDRSSLERPAGDEPYGHESRPSNPAPNFDRLAPVYRWMEWATFGPLLWRCRCHFLGNIAHCRKALVLGDGDGRFTARLLETNPQVEIVAVDASPKMLRALLERSGPNRKRVQTQCSDIRLWQPQGGRYDLVVSHFFLDCLATDEVEALARKVKACLTPAGQWLISDFAIADNWFGNIMARPLVSALYLSFRALTGLRVLRLPESTAALQRSRLKRHNQKLFLGSLLVTELWQNSAE